MENEVVKLVFCPIKRLICCTRPNKEMSTTVKHNCPVCQKSFNYIEYTDHIEKELKDLCVKTQLLVRRLIETENKLEEAEEILEQYGVELQCEEEVEIGLPSTGCEESESNSCIL